MSDDNQFKSVQAAIAEVLDLEPSEVTLESKVMDDLGAESIDLLDIASELEKIMNKEVDFSKMKSEEDGGEAFTIGKIMTFLKTL
jgi:acyl carrier protein